MLTYTSPIPYLAKTLLYLPLDLMRFRDLDTACLRVPMFERLSLLRGSANIPTHVRLEITSDSAANTGSTPPTFNIPYLGTASAPTAGDIKPRALQVYSSKISFCARFHGLRYVIYNYRVLSFLAFTAMFYMSSVVSMALAWAGISTFLYNNGKDQDGSITIKREHIEAGNERKRKAEDELDDGNAKIKEEEQDGSTSGGLSEKNLSDTPASFPTGSREPPLQYPGRPLPPGLTAAQQQRLRTGEVADDEEDAGQNQSQAVMERAWDTSRGRDADSGLGTSLESEGPGLARRRSERMSGSGSRDRRQ
jgi:seipin